MNTIEPKLTHIGLFCDEAGKETDRYLAVGGLVVTSEAAIKIREEMKRHYDRLGIVSEMKWSRTKKSNKEKYQEMIHYFFQLIDENLIRFHCLLVDFERFDHNLRTDGGANESLKRMYYQLILHRLCKKHGKDCNLYAFPDKARELKGLEDLKSTLNTDSKFKFRHKRDSLRAIEFRDSEKELLLQLNDIVLGGICYQKNKRYEEDNAGHPKANLAGYILGKSGVPNLNYDTPYGQEKFSIWNLKSKYLKGT